MDVKSDVAIRLYERFCYMAELRDASESSELRAVAKAYRRCATELKCAFEGKNVPPSGYYFPEAEAISNE